MQPLRITAKLAEFRLTAIDKSLPIDGPLAWAWVREKDVDRVYNSIYGGKDWFDVDLSDVLKTVEVAGESFYACSWAVFRPVKEYITYRYRRFDTHYAERYADTGKRRGGKIIVAGGTFKTWRIPLVTIITDEIKWYCVGNAERIEQLLNNVYYLGSAKAAGNGRISEWIVEPWPEDWSIYGPDDCLMRALPSPNGSKACSIKPPYWAPPRLRCEVPDFSNKLIRELIS